MTVWIISSKTHPGFYEGMLWKKSKENGQFLKRKFVLAEREFTLSYYNREDVRSQHLGTKHHENHNKSKKKKSASI